MKMKMKKNEKRNNEKGDTRSDPIDSTTLRHSLVRRLYSRKSEIRDFHVITTIHQKIITFEVPI